MVPNTLTPLPEAMRLLMDDPIGIKTLFSMSANLKGPLQFT